MINDINHEWTFAVFARKFDKAETMIADVTGTSFTLETVAECVLKRKQYVLFGKQSNNRLLVTGNHSNTKAEIAEKGNVTIWSIA